jgi:RNA polymerase sigma-B factor
VSISAVTARRSTSSESASSADHAGELIEALAGLPADDRSRPGLRGRAVEAWLPLARHLAGRFAGRGEPPDDLVQVAALGLITATDRYTAERGAGRDVDFVEHAVPAIIGELRRHFREHACSIRIPRHLQALRAAIAEANDELCQLLRRSPTVVDVAEHLGIAEEDVLDGLEGAWAYRFLSLSTPLAGPGGAELGGTLGDEDTGFARAELRATLERAMATLDEREQRIVRLRFDTDSTQAQIAELVGVSQVHVSRLLAKAMDKLRGRIGELTA